MDQQEQSQNEYLVEYFDFPEKEEAEFIGQLFSTVETRKKYTTPLIHKLFSLMEQFGVESASSTVEGRVDVKFMDNEYYKTLRKTVGNKFLVTVVYELIAVMRFMNIKSFKRNTANIRVQKLFNKTDKALLAHIKESIGE